ncbi:GNAT family N-acetyltransferase [Nicoliella spurrieriana]|uniref:GNAT family N-acetyltransferase n=1 Tax=Nicoliella spurrieriana TaxID=2925830 RepID=A0A976RT04_9LACO|nr:GNAT family N-acetyltransferase [Nicoliella spurrieriana]UQS87310.1 GNAT family N-acetyltransferase [Nicoliella spurrieriana]
MAGIYLRVATEDDLDSIISIIKDAQGLLKADGSNQWQNGYPTRQIIMNDIQSGSNYVLIVDGKVAATAYLMGGEEPTFNTIEGSWNRPNEQYITIHRIALASQYHGLHLGSYLLSNLITVSVMKGYQNIRFDTWPVNKRMQGLGERFGFEYRGMIQDVYDGNTKEWAYELNL